MGEVDLFNYKQNLFERICSTRELELAFKAVKRNRGVPGVDGITVQRFEQNLDKELLQLKNEVESWSYKPSPVRRVEIPKPGNAGVRLLGIPTVRDRVLHASIKAVLEPIFEEVFSAHSYGFRPKKNQRQAVEAAQKIVQTGKEWVVDIDLSKFFDRIHHDLLINRIKVQVPDTRILRLIGMILRSGIMQEGVIVPSTEGSVQGSPLSPLLSNVVLDELDKELESRGLEFCRFADDCNIFVKTQKAADRVMQTVSKYIEKRLKLVVNREKSKVALTRAVKFLGMTIVAGAIAISAKSMQRAMDKVRDLTPRGTSITIEQTIDKINSWYVGWASYHKMTQFPSQLQSIEAHLRRRLRSRIVSEQKQKRNLCKTLIKRGVEKRLAKRTAYSNKGKWAKSHSSGLEKAYPNKWFIEKLGQKIFSDKELPHWFNVSKWIKLT